MARARGRAQETGSGPRLPGRKWGIVSRLCGPSGTLHNAGSGGRQVQPTNGNLFIALMTPRWIHLETDLLMSGDRAGTAPREACRASSPAGTQGVWSEAGRTAKQRPGFCLGKPQGGLLRLHPHHRPLWDWEKVWQGEGSPWAAQQGSPGQSLLPMVACTQLSSL